MAGPHSQASQGGCGNPVGNWGGSSMPTNYYSGKYNGMRWFIIFMRK